MYFAYKITRGAIKSLVSQATPWQIALGTAFGCLLGFLPAFPLAYGPSPLWFGILFLALVVNCHLGSVLLFFGLCKVLAKTLYGPAVVIGDGLADTARHCADIPLLHLSLFSHTGYLGLTVLGAGFAVCCAIVMTWAALWVRRTILPRLAEQKRLMAAGTVVDRPILVRIACWFFGL